MTDVDVGTLNAYFRGIDQLTPVMEKLGESISRYSDLAEQQMKRAENATEHAHKSMKESFEEGFGVGAGIKAFEALKDSIEELPKVFTEMAEHAVESAHSIELSSAKFNISTTAAQEFSFALGTIGEPLSAMTGGFRKLEAGLGSGSSAIVKATSDLHLNFQVLRNESPDKAMNDVAEALAKVENPAQRAYLGTQLLGRGYMELSPILEKLVEKEQEAQKYHTVVDPNDLAAAAEMGEKVNTLGLVWQGLINNFIDAALNSKLLFTVMDALTNAIANGSKWVQAHRDMIRSWISDGINLALQAALFLIQRFDDLATGALLLREKWIDLKEGAVEVALTIMAVADVTEKVKSLDLSGAKASWETYQGALAKVKQEADGERTANAELYKSIHSGTDAAATAIIHMQSVVTDLGTAQEVTAAKTKTNTGANNDAVKGADAAKAAYDKMATSLNKMWSEVAQQGMTQYEKQQEGVNTKAAEFNTKIEEEKAKLGDLLLVAPGLKQEFDDLEGSVKDWQTAMQEALAEQHEIDLYKKGMQELGTATIALKEAQLALNPTLSDELDIMRQKEQLAEQNIIQQVREQQLDPVTAQLILDKMRKTADLNATLTEHKHITADLNTLWNDSKDILTQLGLTHNKTINSMIQDIDKGIKVVGDLKAMYKSLDDIIPIVVKLFGAHTAGAVSATGATVAQTGATVGATGATVGLAGAETTATAASGGLVAAMGAAAAAMAGFLLVAAPFVALFKIFGGNKAIDTSTEAGYKEVQTYVNAHPGSSFDDANIGPNNTAIGYANQYGDHSDHPSGAPASSSYSDAAQKALAGGDMKTAQMDNVLAMQAAKAATIHAAMGFSGVIRAGSRQRFLVGEGGDDEMVSIVPMSKVPHQRMANNIYASMMAPSVAARNIAAPDLYRSNPTSIGDPAMGVPASPTSSTASTGSSSPASGGGEITLVADGVVLGKFLGDLNRTGRLQITRVTTG